MLLNTHVIPSEKSCVEAMRPGLPKKIYRLWKKKFVQIYIYNTRKIPAFGGISLALRGNGAFGAAFRVPSAPRLGSRWRRV